MWESQQHHVADHIVRQPGSVIITEAESIRNCRGPVLEAWELTALVGARAADSSTIPKCLMHI
ncbi:hypothetical protein N7454_005343 [Penicillium verhagenii]|nr:hypothetical protein N7454_005343 [Penicillium verhagenii]